MVIEMIGTFKMSNINVVRLSLTIYTVPTHMSCVPSRKRKKQLWRRKYAASNRNNFLSYKF